MTNTEKLLPCPFCGSSAHIERYGNTKQSTIVECDSCGLTHESNENFNHGNSWNTRSGGWQEIDEDTPRDRRIQLWSGKEVYIGHWVKNIEFEDEAWLVGLIDTDDECNQFLISNPTHWCEAAAPPEGK